MSMREAQVLRRSSGPVNHRFSGDLHSTIGEESVVDRWLQGQVADGGRSETGLLPADAASRAHLVHRLQGLAGNRSVVNGLLRGGRPGRTATRSPIQHLQRCGPRPCDCPADQKLTGEPAPAPTVQEDLLAEQDAFVQRASDDLPGLGPFEGFEESEAEQKPEDLGLTEGGPEPLDPMTLIDPRLDVGAQRSLARLSKGTIDERLAAHEMADAVKAGTLAGIFGDDLGASAKLAARLGTVRWELVPKGEDAVLIEEPEGPPTMVFREGVRSIPARIDPALVRAWRRQGSTLPACEDVLSEPEGVFAQDPSGGALGGEPIACIPQSKPSAAVKGVCQPSKTISGVIMAGSADLATAATMLAGSAAALAKQNIRLDIDLHLVFPGRSTEAPESIDSEEQLCAFVREALGPGGLLRTKAGVIIVVAPFGGPLCTGHAQACLLPSFGSTCPGLPTSPQRLILISPFASTCPETVLAHELGHSAGIEVHRELDPGNYMGFLCPRDHFTEAAPPNDDLAKVCAAAFQF